MRKWILGGIPIILLGMIIGFLYYYLTPRVGVLGESLIPKSFWWFAISAVLISINSLIKLYYVIQEDKKNPY